MPCRLWKQCRHGRIGADLLWGLANHHVQRSRGLCAADGDPRTPDIIVTPNYGVVYTSSTKKQEEHGGFSHDDTNVIMLLSNPAFKASAINTPVETMQVVQPS